MKQTERAAILRIVSDMIKADAIIDVREIEYLNFLRDKYALVKDDELLSSSLSFADSVNIVSGLSQEQKQNFLSDLRNISIADDYLAREEAMMIIALSIHLGLCPALSSRIISFDSTEINFDSSQILYVESEYDNDINWEINDSYRLIINEIRLAGFDFVYLPKIAEHYRTLPFEEFCKIAGFLYPKSSEARLKMVVGQLRSLSTIDFCNDQLVSKLSIQEISGVPPSLMIKINESDVDGKVYANFILLELEENVLKTIRAFLDLFATYYHTFNLNYLKNEVGRFIYSGFYKQIFDVYMLRKGIKSSVVIDVYREEIRLPEADLKLDKLHRREKALYALFLLESSSGGINFTKPESPKQFERYKKRMAAVQEKYNRIYKMFGGDERKAPIIEIPEIRLPMISLIKRQFAAFGEILFHPEDYAVQRNFFGNYGMKLSANDCFCCGIESDSICPLSDSLDWQNISAL